MLEDIRHQLLSIFENCCEMTGNQILDGMEDVFLPHTKTLNQLATLDVDAHQVDALMADSSLQPAIEQISRLKQIHGLRMERQRARAIIDSDNPWDMIKRFIYYPNYLGLAEMESREPI